MKRNKNQAVFRYLPEAWISYRENEDAQLGSNSYTIKIKSWNTRPLEGVYTVRLADEIIRQIRWFERRGGDISSFVLSDSDESFSFVEAAMHEDIPDIVGEISPLLFYCSYCGNVVQYRRGQDVNARVRCKKCKKGVLKQLQMVYVCECGFAAGVKKPRITAPLTYRPQCNSFRFEYYSGKNKKYAEMYRTCTCGKILLPRNATDSMNFRPFTITAVNLINEKEGELFKYGAVAKRIVLGRWLETVPEGIYEKLIKNPSLYFEVPQQSEDERVLFEQRVEEVVKTLGLDRESAENLVRRLDKSYKNRGIDIYEYASKSDRRIPTNDQHIINSLASQFIEYGTIRNARRIITLEEAMQKSLELGIIDDDSEVRDTTRKLGISGAQLSSDIEVIHCSYGYTRKAIDPSFCRAGATLRLMSFERKNNKHLVYCSKLETEGILLEIDRTKILKWLVENEIISEEELPEPDSVSVKRWFLENVKCTEIPVFSDIDKADPSLRVTHYTYVLLHSISHVLVRSAGVLSGLDRNSLAELLFPNVPAIFIYSQSIQGVPLGALSSMFEQHFIAFLKRGYSEGQMCVFDPICSDRDHGACDGCIYLNEISCCHFNKDLSRLYLYGDPNPEGKIKRGFWQS